MLATTSCFCVCFVAGLPENCLLYQIPVVKRGCGGEGSVEKDYGGPQYGGERAPREGGGAELLLKLGPGQRKRVFSLSTSSQ